MARTQAADFDLRRIAIIDQAAILFAARGFLGASIADLASACNISKSLVYHYYSSKEDILFDAMISHVDALAGAAQESITAGGTPAEQLRRLARAFMALYVGAAARHKVLLNDLDHLPDERRKTIITRQRALIRIVEDILGTVKPALAKQKSLLRAETMLFFGMINWTHTWFDPAGPIGADSIANMACDLVLGNAAGN